MIDAPIADSRHVQGAGATLEVTWTDQFGEDAEPVGTVTVRVQNADGTDLVAAGAATTGTSPVTVALTAAQTAALQFLTATWTDGTSGVVRVTFHEIVGAVYASVAQVRAFDDELNDDEDYPNSTIQQVRIEAEDECEQITRVAWVPRFKRVRIDGTDDDVVILPDTALRVIRSVRVYSTPTTYRAFTSTELAELLPYEDGRIRRPAGKTFDQFDPQSIVVEYEHGNNRPPPRLQHAFLSRLRYLLNLENQGIDEQADSIVVDGVGTVQLGDKGTADNPWKTGQREVDRVYTRYSQRVNRVVSRNFDYDPTRNSLYHGGRR